MFGVVFLVEHYRNFNYLISFSNTNKSRSDRALANEEFYHSNLLVIYSSIAQETRDMRRETLKLELKLKLHVKSISKITDKFINIGLYWTHQLIYHELLWSLGTIPIPWQDQVQNKDIT